MRADAMDDGVTAEVGARFGSVMRAAVTVAHPPSKSVTPRRNDALLDNVTAADLTKAMREHGVVTRDVLYEAQRLHIRAEMDVLGRLEGARWLVGCNVMDELRARASHLTNVNRSDYRGDVIELIGLPVDVCADDDDKLELVTGGKP